MLQVNGPGSQASQGVNAPHPPKIKICPPVLYKHNKYKKIDHYCQAANC